MSSCCVICGAGIILDYGEFLWTSKYRAGKLYSGLQYTRWTCICLTTNRLNSILCGGWSSTFRSRPTLVKQPVYIHSSSKRNRPMGWCAPPLNFNPCTAWWLYWCYSWICLSRSLLGPTRRMLPRQASASGTILRCVSLACLHSWLEQSPESAWRIPWLTHLP